MSQSQLRAENRDLRRENKALLRELAACKASIEKQKEKDRAKLWRLIETLADSVAPAIGIADQWEEATMDGFGVGVSEWNRLRRAKVELEKKIATAMGVSVVALGGVVRKRKARVEGAN